MDVQMMGDPMKAQGHPGSASMTHGGPKTHTMYPTVTGSSVIGLKYDSGVLLAADTLGSYGSMAKLRNVSRVRKLNNQVAVGFSGDVADAEFLTKVLNGMVTDDAVADDGTSLTPKGVYSWITRVYYNRRSKFEPLWNQAVVAGFDQATDTPFLGCVNLLGYSWEDNIIATAFGNHLSLPILRSFVDEKKGALPNLAEAQQLIEQCMKVLYARDARSWNKYEVVKIDKSGVVISEPQTIKIDWKVVADYSEGAQH
jgi:20S proteasome subunit beta 7